MVEIACGQPHGVDGPRGTSDRDAIVDYAIAFLDHYVKGRPESVALHDSLAGRVELRADLDRRLQLDARRRDATSS